MNLLLGVTGGIAAYKACEICSQSIKKGYNVNVIMTPNAKKFITPLTFEGLTGAPVIESTFSDAMGHIDLAKWCDIACVAPLTANTMAKLAVGICDDMVTTTLCAIPRQTPILLCPAMNTQMWNNPTTQRNIHWIKELHRYEFCHPISKRLACGDIGIGALAEIESIMRAIENLLIKGKEK